MAGQACLVCPLYRRNPLLHAACAHLQLKRPKDVKEHLLVRHPRPPHCPTCGRRGFQDAAARDAHRDAGECSTPEGGVVIEGLDEGQMEKLKGRVKRGQPIEEQWATIDAICNPDADKLPDAAAFQGDDSEEVIRTMVEHFNKSPAFAQGVFDTVSAHEPHQRQMICAVLEAFIAGYLAHKDTIVDPTAPPLVRLLGPDQSVPAVAVANGAPAAGTHFYGQAAVPNVPTAGSSAAQLGMIGGLDMHPAVVPADPVPQSFGATMRAPNPINTEAGGYDAFLSFGGTIDPNEIFEFEAVVAFNNHYPSPSDVFPNDGKAN